MGFHTELFTRRRDSGRVSIRRAVTEIVSTTGSTYGDIKPSDFPRLVRELAMR